MPVLRSPAAVALALALAATLLFATMHALVRHVSAHLHPFEIAFFRSLFGLLAVAPLILRTGPAAFVSRKPRLLAFRGVLAAASMLCWFYALSVVPLAAATAISFTAVMFSSVGASLMLGERMRVRRWSAVVLGFAGVLVVVRPGGGIAEAGALVAVLSAVLWGAGTVMVKHLSRTDDTVTIVAWTAAALTLATAIPAATVWRWPDAGELGWLVVIGALGTLGTLAWTQALKMQEATAIVPVDFTRLVWASAIGYVAFSEVPDAWTWTGGALIVGSTAYLAWREATLARRGRLPLPAPAVRAPASGEPAPPAEDRERYR